MTLKTFLALAQLLTLLIKTCNLDDSVKLGNFVSCMFKKGNNCIDFCGHACIILYHDLEAYCTYD